MPRLAAKRWHREVKKCQPVMLRGINLSGSNITYYDDDTFKLPIDAGSQRWRTFRVTFKRYMVINEQEVLGTEDCKFVGDSQLNAVKSVWTTPLNNSNENKKGKPEEVNFDVATINDLDQLDYEVKIICRAYDTSSDIVDVILDEVGNVVSSVTNGLLIPMPYGGSAANITDTTINTILREIGGDVEIGSFSSILNVEPSKPWLKPDNMRRWIGYRFIVFSEREGEDQGEIYLTLWRYSLGIGRLGLTGTGIPVGGGGVQVPEGEETGVHGPESEEPESEDPSGAEPPG